MNIKEIKEILAQKPTEEELALLKLDERTGVKKLLLGYEKKLAAAQKEKIRFAHMLREEEMLYSQGCKLIAGCDEAGRGPLAGPLSVAAVILPRDVFIPGLNDSKKLTAKRREELYEVICHQAISITVNLVGPEEIDRLNIYEATKKAMLNCLLHLSHTPDGILIDAMPLKVPGTQGRSLIHGDSLSASIAAASIIAKVTRDRLMVDLDKEFPQYGFAGHKGYGCESHMQAIAQYGPCKWHRRSFEPIKSMNKTGEWGEGVKENILQKIK